MNVIARVWHQAFDMDQMKSVVKYHERNIDLKLEDGYAEALMKVAIEGEGSFSEEFKKFTNIESWTDREKIEEAIGKDLCKEAFRITLEFQALSNFVYVFRNFIGDIEGYEKNADVFVAKDLLKPIL